MTIDGNPGLVIDLSVGAGLVVLTAEPDHQLSHHAASTLDSVIKIITIVPPSSHADDVFDDSTLDFARPFAQTRSTCPAAHAPTLHRHCASLPPPAWPTSQHGFDVPDTQRLGRSTRDCGPCGHDELAWVALLKVKN